MKGSESMSFLNGLPLVRETPREWASLACEQLDEVLRDHAWCEFKAASAGLGMISRFPEQDFLCRPMIALAQEEILHFRQVTDLLRERGVALGAPEPDKYVRRLRSAVCAKGQGLGDVGDHLILNAFVEARSCERFRVLAAALDGDDSEEQELARFYQRLADAESRHWETFRDLAMEVCAPDQVCRRIEEVAHLEADLIAQHPIEARMH